MSLLDWGQVVLLYPDVEGVDGDGNRIRKPGNVSQPVVGRWQYLLSSEDDSQGQEIGTRADFLCRSFPSGFAGRVTYDDRDWDVIGEPTRSGLTAATRHYRVRLSARTPRPVT